MAPLQPEDHLDGSDMPDVPGTHEAPSARRLGRLDQCHVPPCTHAAVPGATTACQHVARGGLRTCGYTNTGAGSGCLTGARPPPSRRLQACRAPRTYVPL